MENSYYVDNYPFNIEGAQKLSMQWSPDFTWDYEVDGYPTGSESVFQWSSNFIPVTYTPGETPEVFHVWMRFKVGDKGQWSTPMRINYPTVVKGDKGDKGAIGEQGDRGLKGLSGKNVELQYADQSYNLVPGTSSLITYMRSRIQGGTWSSWVRVKGIDGVGSGGTGLPSGGTHDQFLAIIGTTVTWKDKTYIYDDPDAVSAMGAKADSNALNHDKYTDVEAIAAMGVKANSNPLNHDRYTDAEAISALGGALTASLPIELSVSNDISHNDADGYHHVPLGGTSGDALTTDGAGNYTWVRPLLYSQLDDASSGTGDVWSAAKITSMITAAAFGIKYSVNLITDLSSISSPIDYELAAVAEDRWVYQYTTGGGWAQFFELDAAHNHDTLYYTQTQLKTPALGAQVAWENLINVPATIGLWQESSNNYIPTNSAIQGMILDLSYLGDVSVEIDNKRDSVGDGAQFKANAGAGPNGTSITMKAFQNSKTMLAAAGGDTSVDLNLGTLKATSAINFFVGGTESSPDVRLNLDYTGLNFPHLVQYSGNRAITAQFDSSDYLVGVAAGTGFNLDLGTTAGTVAEGNHTHPDIEYVQGLLTSSDDLNNYHPGGTGTPLPGGDKSAIYRINGGSFPANFPSNSLLNSGVAAGTTITATSQFLLRVTVLGDNQRTLQEIIYKKGVIAQRYYEESLSIWRDWTNKWATKEEVQYGAAECKLISPYTLEGNIYRGELVAADDLNNYVKMGVYHYDSNLPLTNDPAAYSTGEHCELRVATMGSYIKQIVRSLQAAKGYEMRYSTDRGVSWSAWSGLDDYIESIVGSSAYSGGAFTTGTFGSVTSTREVPSYITYGAGIIARTEFEDTVRIVGWLKINSAVSGWVKVAVINSPYKPTSDQFITIKGFGDTSGVIGSSSRGSMHIKPNGDVYLYAYSGIHYYYVSDLIV